jgi:glycosyltransferase involved in cell wall biosynthesis
MCHLHLIGYVGSGKNADFSKIECWPEIKTQVTFYGFLETHLAYEISKQCKVGLCIKNQPNEMLVSHERKLFEYMCIGLPSIFCDADIYKKINEMGEIGIPVKLTEPQEIAVGIKKLLSSSEVLNSFSRTNLSLARSVFNWSLEEEKLYVLYLHLGSL